MSETVLPESSGRSGRVQIRDEAHVWLCPASVLDQPGTRARYLESLDAGERERMRRYLHRRDGDLFLAAHGFLRETLSRYADLPPAGWTMQASPGGRPELSGAGAETGLRFSLSHTRGMAACLVTGSADCGVDIERRDRRCAVLAVARRMFSPQEYGELEALDEDRRTRQFITLWTLREAYAKALGTGLWPPVRDIRFRLGTGTRVVGEFVDGTGTARQWQFRQYAWPPDWQVSVALRAAGRPMKVRLFAADGRELRSVEHGAPSA